MATGRAQVTDLQIKSWQREKPAGAKSCGGGLYFRVRKSGACQWYFRYSIGGRQQWMFLGRYPDKSLADARKEARRQRVAVDDGHDVARQRLANREAARTPQTVADLADYWYSEKKEGDLKHPKVIRRQIDNHIIPVIGKVLLTEVKPMDVERVLRKIRKRFPPTSTKVLQHMFSMFKFAGKLELMENNPAANFDPKDAGGKEKPRTRYLDSDELKEIFVAMRSSSSFGRLNELSVLLLLVLCVRKMELLGAKWDAFDLERGLWRLRGERTKTSDSLVVPLPPPVIGWLNELKVFAAGSSYVFPARRITKKQRNPHVSPDTLNSALKGLGCELEHFTVHDFRRTARTHLSDLGVAPDIAERALNHKILGVRGVYDLHDYLNERSAALDALAERLVLIRSEALKESGLSDPAGL